MKPSFRSLTSLGAGLKGDPVKTSVSETNVEMESGKKSIPASISFVPSAVGLIIAGEVVKDLIGFYSE